MRTHSSIALILLAACLPGCDSTPDLAAETAALRETDLAWAAAAREQTSVDEVVEFWSDDASVYPPGAPVIVGKDAIREFVAGGFNTPGFSISWELEKVVVATGGRGGYTTGSNRFTAPDAEGNLVTTVGRYVTIWRKEGDGTWKCVVDIWNTGPMP